MPTQNAVGMALIAFLYNREEPKVPLGSRDLLNYPTFFSNVTRPVWTHSVTKMLPSRSKQASCG